MKKRNTIKGEIAILNDTNLKIENGNAFLEAIYSTPLDTIVFSKSNFTDSFFDLKTGLAGEILQKASNYKIKIIILGDFTNIDSKSFRDLIYESNRDGKIIFADTIENAIEMLK
ncbi:DUF4180 domain-containing protein [Leptospira sp. WS92.C1]